MMPLWMVILSPSIVQQTHITITIPYLTIIGSLLTIIIPLSIGLLIQIYLPKPAKITKKIMRPVIILLEICVTSIGIYSHLYLLALVSVPVVIASSVLPYIGFIGGGVMALICRQPWYRVKTIAIETGIQLVTVSVMLLKLSLPQPDSDLSLIYPLMVFVVSNLTLLFLVLVREMWKWLCKNSDFWLCKVDDHKTVENDDEDDGNAASSIMEYTSNTLI